MNILVLFMWCCFNIYKYYLFMGE